MKTLLLSILSILSFSGFGQQVVLVTPLQDSLIETSGLIVIDDRLITHNDSAGESALYEIDTLTGGISRKVIIENAANTDWEDICHDDTHIYIGDFGNNSGNRTNLRVYRVLISDYLTTPNDTIVADTILFEYADQTDFTATSLSTNFDAEALISWNDSLYIFTKNWGNQWTNVYALPKNPGNYSLPRIDSIDVGGFITGANFNPSSNSIILSGYTFTYPLVVELSDFTSSQFSSFNVNRSQIQLPASYSFQMEGIIPIDSTNYYVSSEQSVSGSSGLFRLNIDQTNSTEEFNSLEYSIYPNPVSEVLRIASNQTLHIEIYSLSGRLIHSSNDKDIDVSTLSSGSYLIVVEDESGRFAYEKVMIE